MTMRPLTLRENIAALLVAAADAPPEQAVEYARLAAKARITGILQDPGPTVSYHLRYGWSAPDGIHTMQCVSPFTWKLEGVDLAEYNRILSDRRAA